MPRTLAQHDPHDRTGERTDPPDRSTGPTPTDRPPNRSTGHDRSTGTGPATPDVTGPTAAAVVLCAREGCTNPVAPPAGGGRPRRCCCDAHRAADRRARLATTHGTAAAAPTAPVTPA